MLQTTIALVDPAYALQPLPNHPDPLPPCRPLAVASLTALWQLLSILPACLSACLYPFVFVCLSVCLSGCACTHLPAPLPAPLPVCLSVCVQTYQTMVSRQGSVVGRPDQAVLQLQEAGVPGLLHLADVHEPALPALVPSPHALDVSRRRIQLRISLQPLPCDVAPASSNVCSHLIHAC